MPCGGSQTLVVGRPTQHIYNHLCNNGTGAATVDNCGNTGTETCKYVGPHDRSLGPRKFREKVREDIKDYVLLMLGAPVVKIELNEQNLDLAINQSLKIFEDYAGREYYDYYTFNTVPGKSVYKMPDNVGLIRNVFYKEQGSFSFQASDLGGVIPVEYFYPGGAYSNIQGGLINPMQPIWGRMGEWILYKQYENMYSRTSSNIGGWEWVSDMGWVKLYPTPCACQQVSVHYLQKCKDWREVTQAMQEGALAHAIIMLGHIRGKYAQPPGPGGGMALDGDYMRQKGWELKDKWQEELITKFGDILPITMG
jgi:hypothetical protein